MDACGTSPNASVVPTSASKRWIILPRTSGSANADRSSKSHAEDVTAVDEAVQRCHRHRRKGRGRSDRRTLCFGSLHLLFSVLFSLVPPVIFIFQLAQSLECFPRPQHSMGHSTVDTSSGGNAISHLLTSSFRRRSQAATTYTIKQQPQCVHEQQGWRRQAGGQCGYDQGMWAVQ